METGLIKYQQLSVSSFYNATTLPSQARIAGPGAWCLKEDPGFLKIDLRILHNICAVATQGFYEQGYYTTNYLLALGRGHLKDYYVDTADFKVMYRTKVNSCSKGPMAPFERLENEKKKTVIYIIIGN